MVTQNYINCTVCIILAIEKYWWYIEMIEIKIERYIHLGVMFAYKSFFSKCKLSM